MSAHLCAVLPGSGFRSRLTEHHSFRRIPEHTCGYTWFAIRPERRKKNQILTWGRQVRYRSHTFCTEGARGGVGWGWGVSGARRVRRGARRGLAGGAWRDARRGLGGVGITLLGAFSRGADRAGARGWGRARPGGCAEPGGERRAS
ncbi:hypothetical protein STTU_2317 [Streptomyces sp. Tu6071]|nr:hypothetical protein STTU_2317 [Streptomyces sp. Tu6071]